MRTILVAQRDAAFGEQLAAELRTWGYRVIECPGPLPPVARCIRCDKGFCPLSEGADLMIYDPRLVAADDAGIVHNLAIESALAHREVPMLLAWSDADCVDSGTLRAIRAAAPWVHAAVRDPDALHRQVQAALAAAVAVV